MAIPSAEELQKLVEEAVARFNALSPEEQAAEREAQRQSYVRAELAMAKEGW